jgi:hypothetical protein
LRPGELQFWGQVAVNHYYRIASWFANLCLNCYWRRMGEHSNVEQHSNVECRRVDRARIVGVPTFERG